MHLSLCVTFKGLVPLASSNNESWCQGLDDLASRMAAYHQMDNGLVSILESEILLDVEHDINRTFEVVQNMWVEVNILVKLILLKPSMVTLGEESKDKATP
ncbi:hypothetical protein VNO77_34735 [Canavalia gladiata]|uniref:fructose-bisphosphate aldolase n=1 Tax=Canavalia gladiata TaxID=3824 RepID=A0AAN9KGY7_CANGL